MTWIREFVQKLHLKAKPEAAHTFWRGSITHSLRGVLRTAKNTKNTDTSFDPENAHPSVIQESRAIQGGGKASLAAER